MDEDEDEVDLLAVVQERDQFDVEPEPRGLPLETGLGPQEWIDTTGPVPVIGPGQRCPDEVQPVLRDPILKACLGLIRLF